MLQQVAELSSRYGHSVRKAGVGLSVGFVVGKVRRQRLPACPSVPDSLPVQDPPGAGAITPVAQGSHLER